MSAFHPNQTLARRQMPKPPTPSAAPTQGLVDPQCFCGTPARNAVDARMEHERNLAAKRNHPDIQPLPLEHRAPRARYAMGRPCVSGRLSSRLGRDQPEPAHLLTQISFRCRNRAVRLCSSRDHDVGQTTTSAPPFRCPVLCAHTHRKTPIADHRAVSARRYVRSGSKADTGPKGRFGWKRTQQG